MLYNVALVSAVQHSESALCIHTAPPSGAALPLTPTHSPSVKQLLLSQDLGSSLHSNRCPEPSVSGLLYPGSVVFLFTKTTFSYASFILSRAQLVGMLDILISLSAHFYERSCRNDIVSHCGSFSNYLGLTPPSICSKSCGVPPWTQ